MDAAFSFVPFLAVIPIVAFALAALMSTPPAARRRRSGGYRPAGRRGDPDEAVGASDSLYRLRYLWMRWVSPWLADGRRRGPRELDFKSRVSSYNDMIAKERVMSRLESISSQQNGEAYRLVYINGSDVGGDARLVCRLALHPDGAREACFLLRMDGVGELSLPEHPASLLAEGGGPAAGGDGMAAGGLRCRTVEPLRSWRISYNGLCRVGIRETSEGSDDRPLVHVRCTLLWSAFTSYFDLTTDGHPCLTAHNRAECWNMEKGSRTPSISDEQDHYQYEQFGMVHGVVQVEGHDEKTLLMRGVKALSSGSSQWEDADWHVINYVVLEDGTCLHVGTYSKDGASLYTGYMTKPNGEIYPAVSVHLPLDILPNNNNNNSDSNNNWLPNKFAFSVEFEKNFTVEIQAEVEERACFDALARGGLRGVELREVMCRYRTNGTNGRGTCQTMTRCIRQVHAQRPLSALTVCKEPDSAEADVDALVLPLGAPSCRVSSSTGGKGSQLAMLMELAKRRDVEFEVPNGFCVTTTAFDVHVQSNGELQAAVKSLSEVSCGIQDGDLKTSCDRTELADDTKSAISRQFQDMFGSLADGQSFAVRSSSVGEDTPQMSAAGQMETYLGMNTMEKIFKAIQECWASLYAFQAVQYRRQYGQSVQTTMAVVVQKIVPANSAGVIFSRDPITGNPAHVVINANFGLGESVVAGVSEADTITLHVDADKRLTVSDTKIGRKQEAIFAGDKGGTRVTSLPSTDSCRCAVTDDICLRLGRIALMLDECFGDARDIEFAVVGASVYLLQARAITTFDTPCHYELLHEFDTGIATDRVLMTTGNIQEMCPGSVTPLTRDHFMLECDLSFQLDQLELTRPLTSPILKTFCTFYNQGFINFTDLVCFSSKVGLLNSNEMGPSICGQVLDANDIAEAERIVSDHNPLPAWRYHLNTLRFLKTLWVSSDRQEKLCQETLKSLTKHWTTAQEQYDDIAQHGHDTIAQVWRYHLKESSKGAISRRVIDEILSSVSKDINTDSEVAMLLSSCPGVESADVPLAIERVALTIVSEEMGERFQDMAPEQALQWLRSEASASAGASFAHFLKLHGHRCIKEIELREKSWGMDPIQTIPILQSILASGSLTSSENKKYMSAEEAVSRLSVRLPRLLRWLMVNLFVPRARKSVACREKSKSISIRVNHQRKEAYWRLARLMVREGRLPDEDLLFFFTPMEIGRLLKERSPVLVSRALRRRRVLPEQGDYRFPLIFNGIPKPISDEVDGDTAEIQLQGLPISPGVVKSTARVVTSLRDAPSIQRGDILVTRITDIGWSPYFPLLKGLVTEIGGIMSHGAVVAREYGLPCVVNVQRATKVFKSGDLVRLDGGSGVIDKMQAE